jgi:hypothetical protein
MGKVEEYRQVLRTLVSWDEYLKEHSNLPGPRANLELAYAVGLAGDEALLLRYSSLDADAAPRNTPQEFLALCGVMGLGYLMARGQGDYFIVLKENANDSRWRIREAVALGLQEYGREQIENLLLEMQEWSHGSLLERRAAVAVLCEPVLLAQPEHAARILEILDGITASVLQEQDRRSDGFKTLCKGLGYGWSVAVSVKPELGKRYIEKWIGSQNPDIRWIMKNNLKKKRLIKMDEAWVKAQLSVID